MVRVPPGLKLYLSVKKLAVLLTLTRPIIQSEQEHWVHMSCEDFFNKLRTSINYTGHVTRLSYFQEFIMYVDVHPRGWWWICPSLIMLVVGNSSVSDYHLKVASEGRDLSTCITVRAVLFYILSFHKMNPSFPKFTSKQMLNDMYLIVFLMSNPIP